jgi:single-strand DNA-binding protein
LIISFLNFVEQMVNRVTLIGNLGRDPEVRRLESGAAVAKFSIATNEGYKNNDGDWVDRTEWHEIVGWRGLAERAENTLKKGMLVYVEGKLSTRKWQDKDGQDRYRTEIVANYFRILNSREGGPSGGDGGYFPSEKDAPPSSQPSNETAPQAMQQEVSDSGADDDLPF